MEKMPKYTLLLHDSIIHHGRILYRIRALRDLPKTGIRADTLGGYVAGYSNLDLWEGDAFIADDAKAFDESRVEGNALVKDHAQIFGDAIARDEAVMSGFAIAKHRAILCGSARLIDAAAAEGTVFIGGHAVVHTTVNQGTIMD